MIDSVHAKTLRSAAAGLAPPPRVRVLIAEDHPVMREGLVALLEQEPGIELAGWADSVARVEELVHSTDPHLILLDLTLGSDDGIELAQRLLRERPLLKIVVLSMHEELMFEDRLLSMGVKAYVTKNRPLEEILRALRNVLQGDIYVTTKQRERMAQRVSSPHRSSPEKVLTSRELAVLRLLAAGKTSAVIAAELSVAEKTVYSHRRNIASKLGIQCGLEMVRYAIQWAHYAQ